MRKILEDIRVLDLTHVWFGPFCTMMLADMGAEVIKLEPPSGASDRKAQGPLFGGATSTFHQLNLNKKGFTLNLKDPKGVVIFKELVKKSDVVIQNFKPGTMERLGFEYNVLKEINPRIIYAALSGFGQDGPYSQRGAYNEIPEALGGYTRLTGDGVDPNGPPIDIALEVAYGDFAPAIFAAMSIIAAIRYRDHTGVGQMIDVAQLDCLVAINTAVAGYTLSGMKPWELKKKYPRRRSIDGLVKTKDGGWIRFISYSPDAINNLKRQLGIDDANDEIIKKKVAEMTRDEAVNLLVKMDVPVAPVYHMDEIIKDPQLIFRDMFIEVEHPKAGKVKVPNFPIKFSETPGEITSSAPLLGQHNMEILTNILGYTKEYVAELEKTGIIVSTS